MFGYLCIDLIPWFVLFHKILCSLILFTHIGLFHSITPKILDTTYGFFIPKLCSYFLILSFVPYFFLLIPISFLWEEKSANQIQHKKFKPIVLIITILLVDWNRNIWISYIKRNIKKKLQIYFCDLRCPETNRFDSLRNIMSILYSDSPFLLVSAHMECIIFQRGTEIHFSNIFPEKKKEKKKTVLPLYFL